MSSSALGLMELVLVFGLLLGFGVWQLVATRRDQRRADDEARRAAERQTPPPR
jgi:lysylphosphatidylglycerol synthetase-like protein (DUF2156 family)